jgi:hypothetical protein
MKQVMLLFFSLLMVSQLSAQQDWVVLSSVCRSVASAADGPSGTKGAMLAQDCKNFSSKVMPGDALPSKGCLNIPRDCVVKLLFNGQAITLESGQVYRLDSLANTMNKPSRLSFTSRFLNFVGKAMDETTDEKKMVENHRKHMETVRAGIRGYANNEFAIQTNLLTAGNMSTENITFYWEEEGAGQEEYLFELYRSNDKMDLIKKRLNTNRFDLRAGIVHLEPGTAYTWAVTNATDTNKKSTPRTFVFDPEGSSQIMTELMTVADYQNATEAEKTLMYAFALEENNYLYDAAAIYEGAVQSYPNNKLVHNTAAAFYTRMDMVDTAKKLLR